MMLSYSLALPQPTLLGSGGGPPPPPALAKVHAVDFAHVGMESFSMTVTIPASEYRAIFVGLSWIDELDAMESIGAITYNGVPMTLVPGSALTNASMQSALYYALAPATGIKTLAIDWSNPVTAAIGVVVYGGVNQVTPIGTAAAATGTSTSASTSVSTPAAGSLVIDLVGVWMATTTSNVTVGAGLTSNYNLQAGASPYRVRASGAERSDGSGSMSRTLTVSRPWSIAAVELKAAA